MKMEASLASSLLAACALLAYRSRSAVVVNGGGEPNRSRAPAARLALAALAGAAGALWWRSTLAADQRSCRTCGVVVRRRKFKRFLSLTLFDPANRTNRTELIASIDGEPGAAVAERKDKASLRATTVLSRGLKLGDYLVIDSTEVDAGGVILVRCADVAVTAKGYWTMSQVQAVAAAPRAKDVLGASKSAEERRRRCRKAAAPPAAVDSGAEERRVAGFDTAADSSALDASNRLLRKAEAVILGRTASVVLVLERSGKSHNYSAVLRTAEALGVHGVWCVDPPAFDKDESRRAARKKSKQWEEDRDELRTHVAFAKSAAKWLDVRDFASTGELVAALRAEGREVWVTDLSQFAEPLAAPGGSAATEERAERRIALCFGTELVGASPELLGAADRRVYLPLRGFADSLNLSVAAALVLQRVFDLYPEMVGAMRDEEFSSIYRYVSRESCSQFDSLPLISLTIPQIGAMRDEERAALRERFYPAMGRREAQTKFFAECAARVNRGELAVEAFSDMRRPDAHRRAEGVHCLTPVDLLST